MNATLITAVVSILAAAVVYTVAVFAELKARNLAPWHIALFWVGLGFDTLGTTMMGRLTGGFEWNLHGALGVIAIALMLIHAGWASAVKLLKRKEYLRNFHHFSLTVWALWMVSLVTGFAIAIPSMM